MIDGLGVLFMSSSPFDAHANIKNNYYFHIFSPSHWFQLQNWLAVPGIVLLIGGNIHSLLFQRPIPRLFLNRDMFAPSNSTILSAFDLRVLNIYCDVILEHQLYRQSQHFFSLTQKQKKFHVEYCSFALIDPEMLMHRHHMMTTLLMSGNSYCLMAP